MILEWLKQWPGEIYWSSPEYLSFLYLVAGLQLVGGLIWWWRWRYRPSSTHHSHYSWGGRLSFWLLLSMVCSLVILALANPFTLEGGYSLKRGSVEVTVIVDDSASMLVTDVPPSRLLAAKAEVINLVDQDILVKGDRVALFIFGHTSLRKVHWSSDLERFAREVERMALPLSLQDESLLWSSDVMTALDHTYHSLDAQEKFLSNRNDFLPQKKSNRVVFLFSDGDYHTTIEEKNASSVTKKDFFQGLDEILGEFRRRGLAIYPVVVGTMVGANLSDLLKHYELGKDYSAELAQELAGLRTSVNFHVPRLLANATSGRLAVLDRDNRNLVNFMREVIDQHRPAIPEMVPDTARHEWWRELLYLSVAVLVLAIILY